MPINLITFFSLIARKGFSVKSFERMEKTIVFQSVLKAMMYPGYSLFIQVHSWYIVFWIHRDLAERSTSF